MLNNFPKSFTIGSNTILLFIISPLLFFSTIVSGEGFC
jgi:hypothetical protein